jgi:thiol-disulfide isomerase/thioredoxin
MNKYLSAGAALMAVQAILIGGYLLLGERNGATDARATAAPETITAPLPDLAMRYVDGSSGQLSDLRGRPLLLHFWATWCPPCRKELPGLLDLADKGATQVLLVALDDDWEPVRRFLDRPVPAYIALADGNQVERRFGVHELPESLVVDRHGNMTLRFRGARDWTSATTLELLPKELR